ncbi:hypothetical protein [Streptomyces sp. H51]|uniref:hypothetical protein n=1 Tax=Streptomyces sp. H51 TaxID=3111770 RepID=UPI002D78AC43|nr:hypothetical protein [Streptomyces sp. H51]
MTADSDRAPTPAGDGEPTRALGPADPEYSATVLSSQWIQRPEPDDATLLAPEPDDATLLAPEPDDVTLVVPPGDADVTVVVPPGDADVTVVVPPGDADVTVVAPPGDADQTVVVPPGDADQTVVAPSTDKDETVVAPPAGVAASTDVPDRTEGTVLRFGPGVTAAVAHRTSVTLAAVPPSPPAPPRRRHRLRRHALPALVLLCVLAFLAWQRLGPSVAVRTVEVTSRPAAVGCDATADVVGVVTTDGRAGSLSYRWTRSDGTASGILREQVARGQRQARLHLLWSFQGTGRYTARAELHLLTPAKRTVATSLTYDCR